MGKIHILDERVAGMIAAGEVVERPSSIIKELCENSIDSGATSISISITQGGIRSIRVSDNGSGIAPEDMPLTVIKHATSKLKTSEDLEKIYTMGFRGEALYSISAVSMMKISSRQKGSEYGTELTVNGGKPEEPVTAGIPEGTTVAVDNLFYNTPARLKFLKKPSVEAAHITELVSKLILSHPEISFRYISNGDVIFHSSGNGSLKDAIMLIYGEEAANRLINVEGSFGTLKITGYIGQPDLSYRTKKYSNLFVNDRYIKDETVFEAVERGYGERLLKGSHPFYVLKILMPSADVDVNVHPNKLFVHFRDERAVAYLTENAVYDAITKRETVRHVEMDAPLPAPVKDLACETEIKQEFHKAAENKIVDGPDEESILKEEAQSLFAEKNIYPQVSYESSFKQYSDYADKENYEYVKSEPAPIEKPYDIKALYKEEIKEELQKAPQEAPLFSQSTFSYKIIGVLFSTYIIIESGENAYIIDQHALHERLLYDKFVKASEKSGIINLLISETITLNHTESVAISDNIELLKSMGYDIEPFGPLSFKVNAVPSVCGNTDVKGMIYEIAHELSFGAHNPAVKRDKVAKAACKAAIKGGDVITEEQITTFLKQLDDTSAIPHCPHGRPIFTVLTKAALEKSFKRRV